MNIHTQKIETEKKTLAINGKNIVLHRLVGNSHSEIIRIMRELAMDDHKTPRLPGPNPVSIERKDFEKLRTKEYVIAEKTDGVRFVMMFARLFGFKVCVIIDRSMTAFLVPLKAIPRVLFQGSIFDGELTVDKSGRECFILFDAVIVSGVTVSHINLEGRLIAMRRGFKDFKIAPQDPIELRLKAWTELRDANARKKIEDSQRIYHTDGVVLVPKEDQVVYGRNFDMFKMKPHGTHTVDFVVMDNSIIGVYDSRSKLDVAIGKIRGNYPVGTIVECKITNNVWDVVGIRTDKSQPNDVLTYEKTLLNIRENISVEELFKLF